MSKVKEVAFVMFVVLAMASIVGINAFNMSRDIQKAKESHRADVAEAISKGRLEFEQEAVARGADHYVIVDPKTGAVEFRWKENEAND